MGITFNGNDFRITNSPKPKFEVGEVVLYQNGDSFKLGVVKTVRTKTTSISSADETNEVFKHEYFVWYHTGDTTALTDEVNLHKIVNSYAFEIKRREMST